ncbi:MAG TPA: FG-GAP-like repeat-containing protein, partial [Candidatus Eisenbacteria bacterium]
RVFVSNGAAVDSSDAFFSICQSLASGTLYPSTGTGIGMATGDFNEDGITDVAEGGCGVRIHLGLGSGGVGNGAFGPASVVPLVGCGTAVATGDFNDDGITDLVAIDGSGLSTLRGQGSGGTGNGSFVRTATYPFPSGPEGLAVADFNEDGIEDIAAALRLQDQVGILFGNGVSGVGTGTFAPVVLVSTGDGPMDVAVQDFNEDGIWDIATSNAVAANVSILIGLGAGSIGNGTFAAPVHYAGIGGSRFLALDMSNDGIVDLVGGSVTLLKGNGSGGVGNGTFAAAVSSVGLYPILGIMDIDHNTLPDLVGLGAGRLELMRNTSSTGTFESAGWLPSMGANPQFAIAGDFLEDQIIDLAGISHSEPALAVALAGGCVSEAVTITLAEPSPTTWNVGTNQTITWSKSFTNFLNIHGWDVEVSRDNGVNWETIARKINNLSFAWTVTGPPSTQVLLRVRDSFRSSVFDVTSQKITIPGSVSGAPAPEPIRNNEITAAPNPSSGPVSFGLVLATAADVRLDVYDVAGRLVHSQVTGILQPGHHELAWNGSTDRGNRAPAGIYWARASWNGFRAERRIVRLP